MNPIFISYRFAATILSNSIFSSIKGHGGTRMGDSSNDNRNARNEESSMWSWGGITEGLSTISGTSNTSDERTDIGASKAEIQEMESAIAAAETAVSSAIFSTFSAVSNSFTSSNTNNNNDNDKGRKSSTDDDGRKEKASASAENDNDSDLDALTGNDSQKDDPSSPNTDFSTSATAGALNVPTEATEPSTASSIWSWSTLAAVSESLSESLDPTELIASTAAAATTSPEIPSANMNSSNSESEHEEGPSSSSSIWSTFHAPSATTQSSSTPAAASSLLTFYSTKVNQASEWIDELQHAQEESDPYQHLKHHLDIYVTENPRGVYEQWITLWNQDQGWGAEEQTSSSSNGDGDSGTVDSSYYKEESIHRVQWNERNYQDGIGIDDESPKRKYILTAKASLRDAAGDAKDDVQDDAKDDSIKGEEDPIETSKDAVTAFL
jgi:hypothetical protein